MQKKKQEERNLRGLNEGDLYATDAITYHIPDERLWMRSKIVFKFGQEVRVMGGVGEQLGSSCEFCTGCKTNVRC